MYIYLYVWPQKDMYMVEGAPGLDVALMSSCYREREREWGRESARGSNVPQHEQAHGLQARTKSPVEKVPPLPNKAEGEFRRDTA